MLGESPCIVINFSELRAEQYIVYIQGDSRSPVHHYTFL